MIYKLTRRAALSLSAMLMSLTFADSILSALTYDYPQAAYSMAACAGIAFLTICAGFLAGDD